MGWLNAPLILRHRTCRSVRVLTRQHAHGRARDAAACGIAPLACEDSEVQIFAGADRNGAVCSTCLSSISAISSIFCFTLDKYAGSFCRQRETVARCLLAYVSICCGYRALTHLVYGYIITPPPLLKPSVCAIHCADPVLRVPPITHGAPLSIFRRWSVLRFYSHVLRWLWERCC